MIQDRLFFTGQWISVFGTAMQQMALGWWAYHLTGSVTWLVTINAFSQLPILFFSPWAGVLGDQINCKKGLWVTQVLALIQSLGLAYAFYAEWNSPLFLVISSLFLGLVNAFEIPFRQHYITYVVPPASLGKMISLNTVGSNFARLLAPALGGFFVAWWGVGVCFLINAASFIIILSVLMHLPAIHPTSHSHQTPIFNQLKEGAVEVSKDFWIFLALIQATALSIFSSPYFSLMPVLMKDVYHEGPQLLGLAYSFSGLGAMLAGFILAHRRHWLTRVPMASLAMLGSSGLILLCWMPHSWMVLPCMFITGFGFAGSSSAANITIQSRVPSAYRGRVMGLFSMCMYGTTPIGLFFLGWISNHSSVTTAFSTSFILTFLVSLVIYRLLRPSKFY